MTYSYSPSRTGNLSAHSEPHGIPNNSTPSVIGRAKGFVRRHVAPVPVNPIDLLFPTPSVSIVYKTTQASSWDLRRYAWAGIADVETRGDPLSAAARHNIAAVLNWCILDNGPTPQVAPTPEGNVEVQWLAGGSALSVTVDPSGDFSFFGTGPGREVFIDAEIDEGDEFPAALRQQVTDVLGDMAKRVRMRPETFYATPEGGAVFR
jgi:hypothetical protein